MNEQNEPSNISTPAVLPVKRKRGRPRKEGTVPKKDEGSSKTHPPPEDRRKPQHVEVRTNDGSMIGKMVCGVIDGSFDAGYLLSVRIGNAGPLLRGVIFEPGRYTPITSTNDIAPQIKMHQRRDLPIPVLNKQNRGNDVGSQSENAKQPVQLGKQPSLVFSPVLPSVQQSASFVLRNQSASTVMPLVNMPTNISSPPSAEKMVMQQNPKFGYGDRFQSSNPVENFRGVEQDDMMQVYEVSVQTEGLMVGTKSDKDGKSESSSEARVYNALPHKEFINQVEQSHNQNMGSPEPTAPIRNELNRAGIENLVAMEPQPDSETHNRKSELQQNQSGPNEMNDPYYTLHQHTVIAEPRPLHQEHSVIERGFQPGDFIQNKLQDINLGLHETPIVARTQSITLENLPLESELQPSKPNHELYHTPTLNEMQSDSMKPENMENDNEVESRNHGIHQDFGNSRLLSSNLMAGPGEFMVEKPNYPENHMKSAIQLNPEAKVTGHDQSSNSRKPIHHTNNNCELDSQTPRRTREALPFDLEIAAEEASWPGRPENQVSSSTCCSTGLNFLPENAVLGTESNNNSGSLPDTEH